jgi:hypothetical protein
MDDGYGDLTLTKRSRAVALALIAVFLPLVALIWIHILYVL